MPNPRPVQRPIVAAARAALRACSPSVIGQTLVAGISGGPDSVCLLLALHKLAPSLHLTLHVAHLDHGLRPAAKAQADAAFVQVLCDRLGIACTAERRPVAGYQRAHPGITSVEAAARAVRYGFFAGVVERTGAAAVATGHTRDDQAETVLLHLLRGAGPDGLAGMATDATLPVDGGRTVRVLRALLAVPRAQTEAFCRSAGIEPRRDPTNDTTDFTRNAIRHTVLPTMAQVNPNVAEALVRLAGQAAGDAAYWRAVVGDALRPAVTRQDGVLRIDLHVGHAPLHSMPDAFLSRLLRAAVALEWPEVNLEASHTDALLALARGHTGRAASLPGGIGAVRVRNALLVRAAGTAGPGVPDPAQLVPGAALDWGGWRLTATVEEGGVMPAAASSWVAHLDASVAGSALTVRVRKAGDRYRPLGLRGAKTLQDQMVDSHIPALLRDRLPVVAAADGAIVWVAGLRVAEAAKVTERTGRTLVIRAAPASQGIAELLRHFADGSYTVDGPSAGHARPVQPH